LKVVQKFFSEKGKNYSHALIFMNRFLDFHIGLGKNRE